MHSMDGTEKAKGSSKLLDLLNQTLELEYTLIVHYPRIASMIKDDEIKQLVQSLGIASVKHADMTVNAVIKYGGTPNWSMGLFPEELSLKEIFAIQLEKEKTALKLHQEVAGLIMDSYMRDSFIGIAKEEEAHIKIVEKILKRLD